MNQDVFLMHFEGRLCQQNSRIPVFVRKLFVYFVIRKEIEHNTASFWPVEVGKILMHFLIVNMNKLDLIRFLQKTKKKIFCQFSRFAVVV